jgi:NAD(P)-dependent dehydrogenase (short-subunit alcohol dehydrogenase family)
LIVDLRLTGKRALVTGASSGLGVAIATSLSEEGVSVMVHGRNERRTAQTAANIASAGGTAFYVTGDLSNDEDAARVAEAAVAALGGVDILVNNAGGSIRGDDNPDWMEISTLDYCASFNINLIAAVRLSQKLVPGMMERGWGRLINISSTAGRQALGALHEYGPAKAALENWGLNLSKNLAASGVTVNTIAPGMIMTPQARGFLIALRDQLGWPDDMVEIQRRYATEIFPHSIERLGTPEEIGAAVTFIASPLSDYTTGAYWRVDGGTSVAL